MRFPYILCICFSLSSFSQSRLKKAKENLTQNNLKTIPYNNASAGSNPKKTHLLNFYLLS